MQHKARKRPQSGIAIALHDPGPGEGFARPGYARGAQKDKSWSAFPSAHSYRKLLSDRHPYLATGLDLTDVDAGVAVVDLKVRPSHFDQVRAALPCVSCQRDNPRKLRSGLGLGKLHLFVGPGLMAVV